MTEPLTSPSAAPRRRPRTPPTFVMGLPSLLLEPGQADREIEPRRVIVVEPIAVREDVASAMIGLPVETLRMRRKDRTGPPFRKDGAVVLYLVADLRAYAIALPSPEMVS